MSFECLIWLLLPLECNLSWGVGAVVIVASDKRFAVHVGSLIVWWDISNAFHIASFVFVDVVAATFGAASRSKRSRRECGVES